MGQLTESVTHPRQRHCCRRSELCKREVECNSPAHRPESADNKEFGAASTIYGGNTNVAFDAWWVHVTPLAPLYRISGTSNVRHATRAEKKPQYRDRGGLGLHM